MCSQSGFGCGRGNGLALHVTDQLNKRLAVDQLNRLAARKTIGLLRVDTRCDHNHAVSPFGDHDAVHLPHDLDAHLEGPPLFALDQYLLALAPQDQVNAPVRSSAPGLLDHVALPPVGFADQRFELAPRHGPDGVYVLG